MLTNYTRSPAGITQAAKPSKLLIRTKTKTLRRKEKALCDEQVDKMYMVHTVLMITVQRIYFPKDHVYLYRAATIISIIIKSANHLFDWWSNHLQYQMSNRNVKQVNNWLLQLPTI